MQDRLEALADAIAYYHDWSDPGSRAYQLRNPLLLRAFSLSRLQPQDSDGYRQFGSALAGYRAGLYDLQVKISGRSRARLDEPTLRGLLKVYELGHAVAVKRVEGFLQKALCQEWPIDGSQPLPWFLEGGTPVELMDGERLAKAAMGLEPKREAELEPKS